MGKVRVKTIGDEELERQEQEEARKKAEAKRAAIQKKAEETDTELFDDSQEKAKTEVKAKKKFAEVKRDKHSKTYTSFAAKIDKSKTYNLSEALEILPILKRSSFDETVELHINTTEKGVSGSVTLPHGTGKEMRIVIANASADAKGIDELVSKIESGTIDFDVLIATPDSMARLARVAKVLGPRGLMPNPKNGTVTPKPDEVAKQFKAGQVSFKTEAKAPIIHASVGKISFGDKKLSENITAFLKALPNDKVRNITLKSTMSPGMKIQA